MYISNPMLKANPGGWLSPAEVVGRDRFIAAMWAGLERQSLLLTGERRMGKTSVLRKMSAEPGPGTTPIKRSLQGVWSAEEFARGFVEDVEATMPGLLRQSFGTWLQRLGIKKLEVAPVAVEFAPANAQSWKEVVAGTVTVLDREVDGAVVLLWDELPHMVANICQRQGPLAAREVLDVLRGLRETYPMVRMVFSGSLGLHHVIAGLRPHGGMWVPTHDMLVMDLPPLDFGDAGYLASELLRNESIACDDVEDVAAAIAGEVDCAPYYVHHTVDQLRTRQRTGRCGTVDGDLARAIVAETVRDPQDPWQLQHYVDRIGTYYGGEADVVKAMLDVIAGAPTPPTLNAIYDAVGAHVTPPPIERLRDLVVLLCKDHYLGSGPAYGFKRDLVRRAWLARRP